MHLLHKSFLFELENESISLLHYAIWSVWKRNFWKNINKESWLYTYDTFQLCQIKGIHVLKLYTVNWRSIKSSTHHPHSGFHAFHNAFPTSDMHTQGKPYWLFILLKWSFKTRFLQVHSVFHNKGRLFVTFFFPLFLIYKLDDHFWFNLDWSLVLPVLSWQLASSPVKRLRDVWPKH